MAPRISMTTQQYPDDIDEPIKPSGEKATPMPSVEVQLVDAGDGAEIIPFRTSKRLQGVIYRMIQERESGYQNNSMPNKVRHSSAPSSTRPLKRQHSPPIRMRFDLNQPLPEICEDEYYEVPDIMKVRKKRAKQTTVHFADPISVVIMDEKKSAVSDSSNINDLAVSKNISEQPKMPTSQKTKVSIKAAARSVPQSHPPKQRPLSCFDLLCNHVGPRGWRCYRTTAEDKSFCSYHENTAASFDTGISQTICT